MTGATIFFDPEELLNLSQAAVLLGVSYPTIYALIERGELEPVRIADRQYLMKSAVLELKNRRGESYVE